MVCLIVDWDAVWNQLGHRELDGSFQMLGDWRLCLFYGSKRVHWVLTALVSVTATWECRPSYVSPSV